MAAACARRASPGAMPACLRTSVLRRSRSDRPNGSGVPKGTNAWGFDAGTQLNNGASRQHSPPCATKTCLSADPRIAPMEHPASRRQLVMNALQRNVTPPRTLCPAVSDNLDEDQVPATWFQCDAGIRRPASPRRRPARAPSLFPGPGFRCGRGQGGCRRRWRAPQRIDRMTRSSWRLAASSDRSTS
jgi:hypothetical protein